MAFVLPTVDRPASAGLLGYHLGQDGKGGLEPVPDPSRQDLARWVLESLDFVEVVVVELF